MSTSSHTLHQYSTPLLWVLETTKSFEAVIHDIPQAIAHHKFGLVGEHKVAANLLTHKLQFGTALPFRLAVGKKEGESKTILSITLPSCVIAGMMETNACEKFKQQIDGITEAIDKTLIDIAKQAAQ